MTCSALVYLVIIDLIAPLIRVNMSVNNKVNACLVQEGLDGDAVTFGLLFVEWKKGLAR